MDHIYPLKVCPWCQKTPQFNMFYSAETWLPKIMCINKKCTVQPISKYIPIRKKQKKNPEIIKNKIEKAIDNWNSNNPMDAIQGIKLNFEDVAKEKEYK